MSLPQRVAVSAGVLAIAIGAAVGLSAQPIPAGDHLTAKGEETHGEYTAKLDGKDYPWKGTVAGKPSTEQDAVSWKKIDEWTYENTSKLKGKTLTVSHVVISKDGKSRTNTVTGTNAQGQTVNSVIRYDKQ